MNSSTHNKVDIVCLSLSRWSAEISSPAVALTKEFSKTNRVFFIEHPFSLKDVFTREQSRLRQTDKNNAGAGVNVSRPGVVLPINFLPQGKVYDALYKMNNSIAVRQLRNVLLRNNISNYIFINFFDPFFLATIPADIKPHKYVYQCMDDMSEVAYTGRHGVLLENRIIDRADLVLCTSRKLTEMKKAYSDKVHFHPNAADFDLFNKAATEKYPRPWDMKFSGRKVIGFTGSIEYRTDFELLSKIATTHNDKALFLVGPVSGDEHITAGIDKLPNVFFAGAKDIEELPAYLQHMDSCIIPYKKNKLTASIYPLKINEYLAAGKPVITTSFSDDIISFSDVSYVADTHEQFVQLIYKALSEDDAHKKAARINAAANNTWSKRVEEFWRLLT